QPGEGGVNHPGAGAVAAAEAFLHRLDEFIAMAWPGGDHRQDEQAQFAIIERPPAAPPAAMAVAAKMAEAAMSVIVVRVWMRVRPVARFVMLCFASHVLSFHSLLFLTMDISRYIENQDIS